METTSDGVMQYEDEQLQYFGKKLIPIERLTENAMKKLRLIQKEIQSQKSSNPELCLRDLLLCELATWFNEEFFSWVNSLPCKKCGNDDVQTKGGYIENGIQVEVCQLLVQLNIRIQSLRFFFRHSHVVTKHLNSIVLTTWLSC